MSTAPSQRVSPGATSETPSEVNPTEPAVTLTPGSNVCVNVSNSNEVLLTGTVASGTELSAAERAAQPLVAGARLTDQLTIGTVNSGTAAANTGGAGAPSAQPSASAASNAGTSTADSELEIALHSVPRLSNVDAAVTTDSVRLTGTVNTSQDDQMARDVARQHAPGRSIVDNVTVAGRAGAEPE